MVQIPAKKDSEVRWMVAGVVYALLVMVVGAYFNYTQPYDATPVDSPSYSMILLWTMLYVPLLVFPLFAKWPITKLGFTITPLSLIASLAFAMLCGLLLSTKTTSWIGTLSEAFARTGEEFFFRGFIFLSLIKIFETKRRPWLWAASGSSLLFALVHTQTFTPAYFVTESTGSTAFAIIQRLFNVFLFGFAFALLRYWTKSILPGSIIHSVLQGGPFTIPFALLINGAVYIWAGLRKEQVITGFPESR